MWDPQKASTNREKHQPDNLLHGVKSLQPYVATSCLAGPTFRRLFRRTFRRRRDRGGHGSDPDLTTDAIFNYLII